MTMPSTALSAPETSLITSVIAPTISANQNTTGGTVLTYFAGNHQLAAANEALKLAGSSGSTNAVEMLAARIGTKLAQKFTDSGGDAAKATVTTTQAADGSTTTTCTDGSCTVSETAAATAASGQQQASGQ